MITTITSILPHIGIVCSAVAAVTLYYLFKANRNAPISRKDADILWKLHKQDSHCAGHKWLAQVSKHGDITGFQCQCGYRYTQKRPLLSKAPNHPTRLEEARAYSHVVLTRSSVQFDTRQR
jgi:hypothetical protein